MVTHKPPHAELTNKDVIHSKKLGEGNPVIPPGIHDEYKSIMSQCWEPYDSQPTMMQVAQRLHAFHNELATKSFKIDEFYDEMRAEPMEPGAAKESVYASVTDAVAAIDPGVSLPSTGKQNTKPPPVGKDKPNIADDYVYLHFPSTVESRFVEKFIQYDGIEVPLEKLQAAVSSAFTHLDHEFIAGILECIVLEPRRAPVGLACDCLTYIAKLARDEHGSTDVGDQWHRLCAVIVRVVKYAQQKLPVQDQGKVLQNSFAAAAGLALSKYLSDDSSGTIVMEQLCNMTVSVLELHRTDARLVENAADLIASLAAVSPTILSYLQEHMAIGLLLDAMQAHSGDDMVLVASVKAIGKFPLVYLINPRNTKANMVADEKQSNVLDKTDMYCKMYSEVLCGIMASIARFDEDSCERSSNEEMLLKTCLLTIFKRCLAEENDLDLLERFFFGTQLQHIAFLVALLNIFPDDFNIQNGAIGILSLMLITGSRITVEETSAETEKVDQSSSEKHTKGTNTTTVVSIVKALTPAARRLEVLLERDVGLKFILRSMERFPINDTVHDIFKSMAEDGIIEQDVVITMSRGVYHGGRNAKTRTRTTETNEQYSTAADDLRAAYEAGKEEALVLQKDSNGELITAAPLQASIVLILGIACNSRKDIQVNLLRTRYNEGILYAFRNFSDDPRLIQYGCHAIYSTARCNTLHQKILYELHILKHLFGALNSYSVGVGSAWKVIDGVICALIGLLGIYSLFFKFIFVYILLICLLKNPWRGQMKI